MRNVRCLKPQKEWKEVITIYLYLAGRGAGAFVIGTRIDWVGVGINPSFLPS